MMKKLKYLCVIAALATTMFSCSKKETPTPAKTDTTTIPPVTTTFDVGSITDTYADISAFIYYPKWTVYNVHDPSIKKFGDYYYCYSTDVGFGIDVRSGLQIRRSKDLVKWEYVGWVFSSLPALGSQYITGKGGTPFNALWAPYVMKVGTEYRLYYSLSSAVARLSVIGM